MSHQPSQQSAEKPDVRFDKKPSLPRHRFRWRIVDIAVASVLGIACAIIFYAANFIPFGAFQAVIPGLGGLLNGFWLFAGPLGALIIRKPGAAIYVELLAAVLEALAGAQWGGGETILIGLAEGVGAELIFLILTYRVWKPWTAAVSGALTGVACWTYTFLTSMQGISIGSDYGLFYLIATVISSVLIAGIAMWYLTKALAKTGVLNAFAVGREISSR